MCNQTEDLSFLFPNSDEGKFAGFERLALQDSTNQRYFLFTEQNFLSLTGDIFSRLWHRVVVSARQATGT
jgi:hypothetical protein